MIVFDIGIKNLFLLTFVFFFVFFIACREWAKPMHPEKCTLIGFFVSGLYTFWVFTGGLVILIIVSLAWQYLPEYLQKYLPELFNFFF